MNRRFKDSSTRKGCFGVVLWDFQLCLVCLATGTDCTGGLGMGVDGQLLMHHAEVENLTLCDAASLSCTNSSSSQSMSSEEYVYFICTKYFALTCSCLEFPQMTPKLMLQKPQKVPQESRKMRTGNGHVSILVQVVNANEGSPCLVSLSVP